MGPAAESPVMREGPARVGSGLKVPPVACSARDMAAAFPSYVWNERSPSVMACSIQPGNWAEGKMTDLVIVHDRSEVVSLRVPPLGCSCMLLRLAKGGHSFCWHYLC